MRSRSVDKDGQIHRLIWLIIIQRIVFVYFGVCVVARHAFGCSTTSCLACFCPLGVLTYAFWAFLCLGSCRFPLVY